MAVDRADRDRTDIDAVGDFIREQRRLAQLSVRRLAEMAGVSNPYLSQIERGVRRPSAEILAQIARALHISAESLYIRAGLLEHGSEVSSTELETAIRTAAELTAQQRRALLTVYEGFMTANRLETISDDSAGVEDPDEVTG